MLAQGPDGMVSLVPAQPAAGSALICPPGTGLVNPADLANAYRSIGSEMMQSSVQGMLRGFSEFISMFLNMGISY